jgi:hypothetical protein
VSKLRKKKTATAKPAAKSRAAAKPKARAAKSATTASAPTAIPKLPPDPLDHFIDAAAVAIDLPVEPAWKPAVKANLEVTLRLARLFADFPLPDDAEPAPVFVA